MGEKKRDDFLYSSTRLMLFYSDDVIEKTNKMKSTLGNYMPNQDGISCSFEFDQAKL